MKIENTLTRTIINRNRVRKVNNVQGCIPFAGALQDAVATQEVDSPDLINQVTGVGLYGPGKGDNTKTAIAQAEKTLDALNDLRLSFLGHGSVDTQLKNIRALMEIKREGADGAALQDLLQMIELRAAVELAKRNA